MTYSNNFVEDKKTLKVYVAPKIIKVIKEGGYNLCMSKMVNNHYSVVWKSEANVHGQNVVEWTPSYSIFGAHDFKVGGYAKACTPHQAIKNGEYCILNHHGVLERATGSVHDKSPMYVRNHFKPIHVGIAVNDGYGKDVPIYVSPEKCLTGIFGVVPKEKVLVWFEEKVETGHMIKKIVSERIEVDFTCEEHVSIVYTDKGKWELASYE